MDFGKLLDRFLPALVIGGGAAVGVSFWIVPSQWRALHEAAGKDKGVDPNLLHAIQLVENQAGDPHAINVNRDKNGAMLSTDYGLMQINSTNFAGLGLDQETVFLPERNVTAGAALIADNIKRAPHLPLWEQISVYNAGFSSYRDAEGRLKPKQNADGGLVNQAYVGKVLLWYVFVYLAALGAKVIPIKTPGWERA